MQDVVTKSYKDYVNRLKGGAKSGISQAFGSASDIFAPVTVMELPERIDFSEFEPSSDEQFIQGFANLARNIAEFTREFLAEHLAKYSKGSASALAPEKFDATLKLLTCAQIHLTALEQIDPLKSPDRVKEFFYLSLCFTDKLSELPKLDELMRVFSTDRQKVCKAIAGSLGRALSFGEIGDPAWEAVLLYLRESAALRRDTLLQTLKNSKENFAAAKPELRPEPKPLAVSSVGIVESLQNDPRRLRIRVKTAAGVWLWDVQFAGDEVESISMANGSAVYRTKEEDKNVIMHRPLNGGLAPEMEIIGPISVDPRAGNILYESVSGEHAVICLNNGYRIDKYYDESGERAYLTAPQLSGEVETVRFEVDPVSCELLEHPTAIDLNDDSLKLTLRFLQALI